MHDRTTGNMVSAGYNHTTARPVEGQPPDPHEHKHVFVFNATQDREEGRIKAGAVRRHQAGRRVLHRRLLLEAGRAGWKRSG